MNTRAPCAALLCAAGFWIAGCVERIARIDTHPQGAVVVVNDEEVGISPAKFSFLWYGDYDIIIRKAGYATLKTHHRIEPPWWQIPPFDIVAETLVPGMIRDKQTFPTFELTPTTQPTVQELITRSEQLRERAVFGQ